MVGSGPNQTQDIVTVAPLPNRVARHRLRVSNDFDRCKGINKKNLSMYAC